MRMVQERIREQLLNDEVEEIDEEDVWEEKLERMSKDVDGEDEEEDWEEKIERMSKDVDGEDYE